MHCVLHGQQGTITIAGHDAAASIVDGFHLHVQLLQLIADHLREGAELRFVDQTLQAQAGACEFVDDLLGLLGVILPGLGFLLRPLFRQFLLQLQLGTRHLG